MIGVGYRRTLDPWIATRPAGIDCLEITAEHFYEGNHDLLRELARDYTLFVHGLGLSLGSPGPLDRGELSRFAEVVEIAQPAWISEHIAFTRTAEVDLGHLNPLRPTGETARLVAEHAREVADHCGRPIILENITSHLRMTGDLSEPEFLNEVCAQAACGLLLDVTNLYINSRNHSFDPIGRVQALNPELIVQLHIVGYSNDGERFTDGHAEPIQPDLLALAREIAPVKAIILERDENFPALDEWTTELNKLHALGHGD